MAELVVESRQDDHSATPRVSLRGDMTVQTVARLEQALAALPAAQELIIDVAQVDHMDTAGAWALARLRRRREAQDQRVRIDGLTAQLETLLERVDEALPQPDPPQAPPRGLLVQLDAIGRAVAGGLALAAEALAYFGIFLARLGRSLRHPGEFRLTSLVHHCQDVGWRAVPIVALMGFLIGIVLAFQGSVQLRQFGAEVFVVELIAISMLRELGVLLTAIIVAGRTGSAFTAAIGAMRMREEVDAMRTLGIDPGMVLFVPRILALLITLPILTLVANVAGLVGGALMAWAELGIAPQLFYIRLTEQVSVDHAIVGLVKAPVFAVIIGVIGCHAGMRVEGNTESLGRLTSSAVVAAIFAVIAADAMFSVFYARVGM